jgi:hypothetical protein
MEARQHVTAAVMGVQVAANMGGGAGGGWVVTSKSVLMSDADESVLMRLLNPQEEDSRQRVSTSDKGLSNSRPPYPRRPITRVSFV